MKQYRQLKKALEDMEGDFFKFYDKKNAAAGTRIRLGMQELKNQANDIRKEVQELKKSK